VVRRFVLLVSFLSLCLAQVSFGATVPLPPRQKIQAAPPPPEAVKAPAVNILSIIPAQGEPGITVTLYGTGFSERTTVFLANTELSAKAAGSQQLSFDIPKLDPGLYALFLKREDGTASRPYNFTVLPVRPVASSLSPDEIHACSTGRDRDVIITGLNFRERSQVLFDGAAIRSRYLSAESLSFIVPQVAGGLHQVQVKNPEDTVSGQLGLLIDSRPEITGFNLGDTYVNYYNLIIEGRNFMQNSSLVVTEERTLEETPSRLSVDVRRISSGAANSTEREQIIFINCNRIIYQRQPYSTVPKNFKIQVISPGSGGESSIVSVSAP
jgi:hypothetical protein